MKADFSSLFRPCESAVPVQSGCSTVSSRVCSASRSVRALGSRQDRFAWLVGLALTVLVAESATQKKPKPFCSIRGESESVDSFSFYTAQPALALAWLLALASRSPESIFSHRTPHYRVTVSVQPIPASASSFPSSSSLSIVQGTALATHCVFGDPYLLHVKVVELQQPCALLHLGLRHHSAFSHPNSLDAPPSPPSPPSPCRPQRTLRPLVSTRSRGTCLLPIRSRPLQ